MNAKFPASLLGTPKQNEIKLWSNLTQQMQTNKKANKQAK